MSRSLEQWLSYQQGTHSLSIDLSLERVREVAARLGLLERPAPAVIVAGTNGKGSTATTLACLLQSCGRSVGLFTSPHLVRYNERIRLDGVQVSDAALLAAFERIEAARAAVTLTFFEYNTLAALEVFRRAAVDVMVLEVGLGGRLDAVNIIDAQVAILCSIGFDHREWLGSTLEQIGAEKAGIFRRGQQVVLGSAAMPASVWQAAHELDCRLWTAEREFSWRIHGDGAAGEPWEYHSAACTLLDLPAPALAGSVQYRNSASAITALQLLGLARACDRTCVAQGLQRTALAGRFQIVPGAVEWILDVAHNEPAAEVLAGALAARPCDGRSFAVAGMLSDKDAAAVVRTLDPLIDHWLLTGIDDEPRALTALALQARLPPLRGTIELTANVAAACERARALARPRDRVIVFGSFHVVGPALAWLGLY
ncbi:MAG: bifunctional tetrahydrofolate synthase/dihydrofolate synthase [Steroidobacterales bacterium]